MMKNLSFEDALHFFKENIVEKDVSQLFVYYNYRLNKLKTCR